MKLKQLRMLSVLCVCLLAPATSFALLYDYSVYGSVLDKQGNTLQISGAMNIDDQLRDWNTQQPVALANDTGKRNYGYHMTAYSLTVGDYSFSGDSGDLYLAIYRSPTLNDIGLSDSMWFLDDGVGAWKRWYGEQVVFFNADGTQQNASQYQDLAPLIHLSQSWNSPDDPILPDHPGASMWLARESSAPVPEPSTSVLLGASLLAMLAYRKVRQ